MKVLHLNNNIKFGGSEQQMIYLIESTSRNGVENFIFCYEDSDINIRKNEIDAKIYSIKKYKIFDPKVVRFLKKIVKENNIEIIHIHTGQFILTYMLAYIFLNLKCKAIFSKKDMSPNSSLLSKIKYNFKGIVKTTCVTEAIKERFKEILYPRNHHKLVVLRDGVDLNNLNKLTKTIKTIHADFNIQSEKIIIGNVANHVEAKDLKTLINMIDYLVNEKKITNFHVVQIGRYSNLTHELQQIISEKQLDVYITLTDFIKNGFEYTSQFDYFIMTSKTEGMPLSILESFYYKIPVIATRAGGIPEVLINSENSLLSPVGDYKSLADSLIILMNNETLKNNIIKNAFILVNKDFDHNIMAEKTIALYNELVCKKSL